MRGGVEAGHQRGVGAERDQPAADEDQDGVTRFQTIQRGLRRLRQQVRNRAIECFDHRSTYFVTSMHVLPCYSCHVQFDRLSITVGMLLNINSMEITGATTATDHLMMTGT